MFVRLDSLQGALVEALHTTHLGKAKVRSANAKVTYETDRSRFVDQKTGNRITVTADEIEQGHVE